MIITIILRQRPRIHLMGTTQNVPDEDKEVKEAIAHKGIFMPFWTSAMKLKDQLISAERVVGF